MSGTPERGSSPANLNDLFDYDVGLEDIFQGANDSTADTASKPANGDTSGLGLDEEVKVTKKRQPVAKLDDNRLLSEAGIPKLRRSAKQKLRFKGKGHEFSDAARLLNFYQLWLDNLFPRAKFADGLSMIEKLGHTKRIQTMRKEWIEEEKPKLYRDEADPVSERRGTVDLPTRPQKQDDSLQGAGADGEGDADADALFIPDANTSKQPDTAQSHPEPDDDDLEDLLREEEEMAGIQQSGTAQTTSNGNSNGNGDFDDFDADYEAMNEMGL